MALLCRRLSTRDLMRRTVCALNSTVVDATIPTHCLKGVYPLPLLSLQLECSFSLVFPLLSDRELRTLAPGWISFQLMSQVRV